MLPFVQKVSRRRVRGGEGDDDDGSSKVEPRPSSILDFLLKHLFIEITFPFSFSNFFLVCVSFLSLSGLRFEFLFLPTFLEIHSPKKVTRFYLSCSSSSCCWLIIGLTKCSDATPHFYFFFFFSPNRTRRSLIAAA